MKNIMKYLTFKDEIKNKGELIGSGSSRDVYMYGSYCYKIINDFSINNIELYDTNIKEYNNYIKSNYKYLLTDIINQYDNYNILEVEPVIPLYTYLYYYYRDVFNTLLTKNNYTNKLVGLSAIINNNKYYEWYYYDVSIEDLVEFKNVYCDLNMSVDMFDEVIDELQLDRKEVLLLTNIGVTKFNKLVLLDYSR